MIASSEVGMAQASRSSKYGPLVALVLVAAAYVPLRLSMESPSLSDGLYNAFYAYGTALQVLFAGVIITAAVRTGAKRGVGLQWLLLGTGVAMFALGDIIWTVFELALKIDPFPSIADAFYSSEYIFFVAAILLAIRGYAGLVKIRTAVILAALVAVVGVLAVYVLLLAPYIFPGANDLGFWGLFFSVLYPVGDVVFMLAPAIALAMVVAQLGAGKLARPWWIVVAGALVFAFADSLNAYAEWAGSGVTPVMDIGWIAANLLFAVAALVATNAYRTA